MKVYPYKYKGARYRTVIETNLFFNLFRPKARGMGLFGGLILTRIPDEAGLVTSTTGTKAHIRVLKHEEDHCISQELYEPHRPWIRQPSRRHASWVVRKYRAIKWMIRYLRDKKFAEMEEERAKNAEFK